MITRKIYTLKRTPLKRKPYRFKRSVVKSSTTTKQKRAQTLTKDEETYYVVFYSKPCVCEECGRALPETFYDENGKIVCRGQYSHILSKGAYPEFRHVVINFNRLCPVPCHDRWEFGDRENMKIYKPNQIIISSLLNERTSSGCR